MIKKVYLDEKYKLDCESSINYIEYIRNNSVKEVIINDNIPASKGDTLYYYHKINNSYVKRSSQ